MENQLRYYAKAHTSSSSRSSVSAQLQQQYHQQYNGPALPRCNPYMQQQPPLPTRTPVVTRNPSAAAAATPMPSPPAPLTLARQLITAVEGVAPTLQNIVATVNPDCRPRSSSPRARWSSPVQNRKTTRDRRRRVQCQVSRVQDRASGIRPPAPDHQLAPTMTSEEPTSLAACPPPPTCIIGTNDGVGANVFGSARASSWALQRGKSAPPSNQSRRCRGPAQIDAAQLQIARARCRRAGTWLLRAAGDPVEGVGDGGRLGCGELMLL